MVGEPEGDSLVVTTSLRPGSGLDARARRIAADLQVPYAPRQDKSTAHLVAETGASRLLLVGVERVALRDVSNEIEYAFHPNMTPVRAAKLLHGGRDPFAEATGLGPGDRLLDCTLGFAAEATLGALLVGETGLVVGLESVPELAAVTREGLRTFPMPQPALAAAMRRVTVITTDYRDYLPRCASGAFDVVCFDPFFPERLPGAENSVSPLAHFGNPAPLDAASVGEARRVARRRVVVKHPRHEPLPSELAGDVSDIITARHSRLAYSVLPALPA
ncbi:MAG: class I SAM-dependent methyltransferase [Armatimonadetes bacterium]|nr:class I SAM-dependent methyltransferase [Armatimonadota bacterium]